MPGLGAAVTGVGLAMRALMRDLAPGAFTYAPPALALLERAIDIDRQYADLGLGLVDASVVALAGLLLGSEPCPVAFLLCPGVPPLARELHRRGQGRGAGGRGLLHGSTQRHCVSSPRCSQVCGGGWSCPIAIRVATPRSRPKKTASRRRLMARPRHCFPLHPLDAATRLVVQACLSRARGGGQLVCSRGDSRASTGHSAVALMEQRQHSGGLYELHGGRGHRGFSYRVRNPGLTIDFIICPDPAVRPCDVAPS